MTSGFPFCDTNTSAGRRYGLACARSNTFVTLLTAATAAASYPGPYTSCTAMTVPGPMPLLFGGLPVHPVYPCGRMLGSKYDLMMTLRRMSFPGRPREHLSLITGAMVLLAARNCVWEMYTPYLLLLLLAGPLGLLGDVVLVPFHAVMPPPQLRSESSDFEMNSVPKP